MAIYRIKRFSLPSDWDEDDEAFVEKINKANKERQQKIDNFSPQRGAVYLGLYASLLNSVARNKPFFSRSSIVPAAVGGGVGYLLHHLKHKYLKKKIDKSNQIKSNYEKLESKDKRLIYKNNYGNIQN